MDVCCSRDSDVTKSIKCIAPICVAIENECKVPAAPPHAPTALPMPVGRLTRLLNIPTPQHSSNWDANNVDGSVPTPEAMEEHDPDSSGI